MLVLTRKTGQSLVIGDGIEVRILAVSGDKVRVGVSADKDVPIYREEVYARIATEEATERRVNGKSAKPAA